MSDPGRGSRFDRTEVLLHVVVASVACAVLPLLAGFDALGLPFAYSGDALFGGAVIKGMIEQGWYLVNPALGAPGSMNLADYPGTDLLNVAIVKVLSWFSGDWAVVMNLYFLVGFPLIASTALWSLRRLGLGRLPAAAAALLYAFLPLHFQRGETHLFLSAYYVVPLATLVAAWMMGDHPPVFGRSAGRFGTNRRGAVALFIAVLLGTTGVYYAFFACYFFAIAAITGSARRHDRGVLLAGAGIVATVVGISVLAMSPSLLHLARAGRNSSVVVRSPIEAEIYGLKLDALLLPVEGHRLPVLETVRTTYLGMVQAVGPAWNNEAAQLAGIGLVAGSGLLFLLAWLLVGRSEWAGLLLGDRRDLVTRLATLNVGGILLATVGGMGAAVAVVLPQIRAYNRISVYLGFFSIAAIALLLDAVREHLARRGGRLAAVLLVLAVAVFGLLDQVPERDRAAAVRLARQFQHDHAFVAAIELRLGPGKAVFQLPFVPFPESPPVNRMTDYQHFRAYLHSRATRWSYGAVKGRPTSEWQQGVAALPFGEMVPELKRAGFAGIWINRGGYADAGAAILSQAQGTLGTRPIWSEGSTLVFIPFE